MLLLSDAPTSRPAVSAYTESITSIIYIHIVTNIYNSKYTNLHLCLLLYMLQSRYETNILIVVCLDICSALVEDVE